MSGERRGSIGDRAALAGALAAAIGLLACGGGVSGPCARPTADPWRTDLVCADEFDAFATAVASGGAGPTAALKTVVDRQAGDVPYFLDSHRYPVHRPFVVEHLGLSPSAPFLDQYGTPDARFLLGSLVHYADAGLWAYELAPYDASSTALMLEGFRAVRRAVRFDLPIVFHATSEAQRAAARALPADVRWLATEDLVAKARFAPLVAGTAVGRVRLASPGATSVGFEPADIAVLPTLPAALSPVAALVTAAPQTPLSHVSVLARQWGIPNMVLDEAEARFRPLEGHWIVLTVGLGGYDVREATPAEIEGARPHPHTAVVALRDLTRRGVLDVDALGLADLPAVGGKAAHFAELRRIPEAHAPRALAVPVGHYQEFVERNGLGAAIDAALAAQGTAGAPDALRDLQVRLLSAPVDPALVAELGTRTAAVFGPAPLRFRSSSNVEDLPGQTAAGVYESVSVEGPDEIAGGLRHVWASLWSADAIAARDEAGVDQHSAAMAVLVHPAFKGEHANGVAITANVLAGPDGDDAFLINSQRGEVSVVQPPAGTEAEELIYYFHHLGQPVTVLRRSNVVAIGGTETVLARRALFDLGTALDAVRTRFELLYPARVRPIAVEVEFKVVADGDGEQVVLKQARLFPDQR